MPQPKQIYMCVCFKTIVEFYASCTRNIVTKINHFDSYLIIYRLRLVLRGTGKQVLTWFLVITNNDSDNDDAIYLCDIHMLFYILK